MSNLSEIMHRELDISQFFRVLFFFLKAETRNVINWSAASFITSDNNQSLSFSLNTDRLYTCLLHTASSFKKTRYDGRRCVSSKRERAWNEPNETVMEVSLETVGFRRNWSVTLMPRWVLYSLLIFGSNVPSLSRRTPRPYTDIYIVSFMRRRGVVHHRIFTTPEDNRLFHEPMETCMPDKCNKFIGVCRTKIRRQAARVFLTANHRQRMHARTIGEEMWCRRTLFLDRRWNKWERRVDSVSPRRLKCQCFQSSAAESAASLKLVEPQFRFASAWELLLFFLMTTERSEKCSLLRQKVCQAEAREARERASGAPTRSIKNICELRGSWSSPSTFSPFRTDFLENPKKFPPRCEDNS